MFGRLCSLEGYSSVFGPELNVSQIMYFRRVGLINLFKCYVLCDHDPDFARKGCVHMKMPLGRNPDRANTKQRI